jgi:hypothetical protein
MQNWPRLERAITSIIEAAVLLNEGSHIDLVIDMSIQMECIELCLMTADMDYPEALTKEIQRIRTIRDHKL